jgi:hypothetical protein
MEERTIYIRISGIDATVLAEVNDFYELVNFYSKIERKLKNNVYQYIGEKVLVLKDMNGNIHKIKLITKDGLRDWYQKSEWIINNDKRYIDFECDKIVNDVVRCIVNKTWKYIENCHLDLKKKKYKFYIKLI